MFVPLHVKSDYSLGLGTASVEELVDRAAELGYRQLALTDRENLSGQVRFHEHCRLKGIRPLTGLELNMESGDSAEGRRAVLVAAEPAGYRSLCHIVSLRRCGHGRALPPRPDDLPQLLATHHHGLFMLSDDADTVERLVGLGVPLQRLGLLLVRPAGPRDEEKLRLVSSRLGVPLVADLDVLFTGPGDQMLHMLQLAIRRGCRLSQVIGSPGVASHERWLRPADEAKRLFADHPAALAAATEIAEACHLVLEDMRVDLGALEQPEDALSLERLCREALAERQGDWDMAHEERLRHELELFARLGFSGFMRVVAQILAHCRQEHISVIVRGSAVSSLALHVLAGSPIDPLAHGLLLQRFLHARKSAWPDVDLDIPWHLRDRVIAWVYDHFGHDHVAMISAHHTFRYRAALREGLKAWGAAPGLIQELVRVLPPEDLGQDPDVPSVEDTALIDAHLERLGEKDRLSTILGLIRRLVGRPRHIAAHPGGIVIDPRDLAGLLPLETAPKGVVVTQYDLVAVARLGLVKIDLLGNRCLSEIDESFRLKGQPLFRLQDIPLEDKATLEMIDHGDTLGCFQIESPAMRSLLGQLPIGSTGDLVAALALIRPGAAAGALKNRFIARARGRQRSDPAFPGMEDHLAETYGLFLYEEDIMVLLSRIGGFGLEHADELRRAIIASGNDDSGLNRLASGFARMAKAHGSPASQIARAWDIAIRLTAYSFNKAHTVSYALLAYYSAYTKRHLPLEFACSLLNHHQGIYPLRTLVADLARAGIAFRPPHVNHAAYPSTCRRDQPGGDAVQVGLNRIRGLTQKTALRLLDQREKQGPFSSFLDLLVRVRPNLRELKALVLCGACDDLPPLTATAYPFAHEAVLEWSRSTQDPAGLAQLPLPRPAVFDQAAQLYQGLVRTKNELAYLEMYLKNHPLSLLRSEIRRYGGRPINEAATALAGTQVRIVALVAAMRRVRTGRGIVQFLTLEDESGLLEAVLLPPVYRRVGEQVVTPGPFFVEGIVKRHYGSAYLQVTRLLPFHRRRQPFR